MPRNSHSLFSDAKDNAARGREAHARILISEKQPGLCLCFGSHLFLFLWFNGIFRDMMNGGRVYMNM